MNKPHQPEDPPTQAGTGPDDKAGGKAAHGIPKEMEQHEPKGSPNSDRQQTETIPAKTGR